MTKTTTKKRAVKSKAPQESDSVFFLKIVLYIILGALWIRFSTPLVIGAFTLKGFPIGIILGVLFASHDHFQIDRKIEYALLIVVMLLTCIFPLGIII